MRDAASPFAVHRTTLSHNLLQRGVHSQLVSEGMIIDLNAGPILTPVSRASL